MRILSVIAQRPDSTGSGVYLRELVRALDRLGCPQAVVAGVYREDSIAFAGDAEFYPVYYNTPELPYPIAGMSDEMPYKSTMYRSMTEEMTERFRSAFIQKVNEAAERFRPDLIICHHLYLLTAMVRESFPDYRIFGICHGTDLRQMKKNPMWREYIRGGIQKLDGIFCLHSRQKDYVIDTYGADSGLITISGNGYNSDIFHVSGDAAAHDGYRLSFAGKISEKKGVFSLIRALGLLPFSRDELKVELAGGYANDSCGTVLELIKTCPYNVELLGSVAQERLARVFSASDVFVLPSFFDGLPLVLAEAMACGARVICTDLPGIRPWMDEFVPGHRIRFVAPPPMLDEDTPDPRGLPRFERELAEKITEALLDKSPYRPDLSAVSWTSVAKTILEKAGAVCRP